MPKRYQHQLIDGIVKKRCSKYEKYKPLDDFNNYHKAWDNKSSRCRECDRKVKLEVRGVEVDKQSFCVICRQNKTLDKFKSDNDQICLECINTHAQQKVNCSNNEVIEISKNIDYLPSKIVFTNQTRTKICFKCQEIKSVDEFHNSHTKSNGLQQHCKTCNLLHKQTDEYREYNKLYNKEYRESHKQEFIEYRKKYYAANIEYIKEKKKDYLKHNKDKINKQVRDRYHSDINFKLTKNLRSRVTKAIKNNSKCEHNMDLIGCTIEELKQHLEVLFEDDMTWENYGKWHIDHIIPCAEFDFSDPIAQKICFNYHNLQPLWAEDNLSKSSNIDYTDPDIQNLMIELSQISISDSSSINITSYSTIFISNTVNSINNSSTSLTDLAIISLNPIQNKN